MSSLQEIKVKVDQLAATAPLANAEMEHPTMSLLGQTFVANWQTRLAMAGRVFSLDLGTAGTQLAGNHDMTTDEPEFVVAADTGWLIPMSLNIAAQSDCDASLDSTQVLVVADRTQSQAVGATGTVEIALNLLDGGDAFDGRCWSVITGALTAVTEADILFAKIVHTVLTTAGHVDAAVNVNHEWLVPRFLKGPCKILGYIVGVGTTQVSAFYGNFVFAHLPVSWITIS